MRIRSHWVIVAFALVAALVLVPATASADCNGPGCEPLPAVDGGAVVLTFAIVLTFFAVMAVAEIRRR